MQPGVSIREWHEAVLLVVVSLHALADRLGSVGAVRGLEWLGVRDRGGALLRLNSNRSKCRVTSKKPLCCTVLLRSIAAPPPLEREGSPRRRPRIWYKCFLGAGRGSSASRVRPDSAGLLDGTVVLVGVDVDSGGVGVACADGLLGYVAGGGGGLGVEVAPQNRPWLLQYLDISSGRFADLWVGLCDL